MKIWLFSIQFIFGRKISYLWLVLIGSNLFVKALPCLCLFVTLNYLSCKNENSSYLEFFSLYFHWSIFFVINFLKFILSIISISACHYINNNIISMKMDFSEIYYLSFRSVIVWSPLISSDWEIVFIGFFQSRKKIKKNIFFSEYKTYSDRS